MAPMPLTGTIGTTTSLKSDGDSTLSHRRSLPEPVVSFHLPATRRLLPSQLDKPRKKGNKQGAKEEQLHIQEVLNEKEKLDVDSSLILLQSLRQSRLIHLTALLPYLSTRHRTSTKYHSSPPDHPFPGGLDPSTTSHSLIHLGRADVRTGPLIFPKTRFGEVRVEGGLQDSRGAASLKTAGKAPDAKKEEPSSSKPATAPPPATFIDDGVVKAVSLAAQKDPKLQALLHTAANGKATPEELKELATFIQQVSAQLKEKASGSATASKPVTFVTANPTTAVASAPGPTTSAASTSASAIAPSPRLVPPPPVNEVPSYPPIITVEYRENPSARFILPLWRGCAVERISKGGERSIKVTMLLPAIGSTAASRALESKSKAEDADTGQITARKTSPLKPPSHEQLTTPAPKGSETHAMTWLISGNSETPLSDGIWQVFGRVAGATTITIVGEVASEEKIQADERLVQQFVEKLRASMVDLSFTPRLRVEEEAVPRDLLDHLTDKFAPRMLSLTNQPIVKLKRGETDDNDVEIVREKVGKRNRVSALNGSSGKKVQILEGKRKRTSTAGSNDNEVEGEDSLISLGDDDLNSKPKRKRHVAKHNPDGTLKLCQACSTNLTPMWRRGPAGKSTLCNACGAKWKVGRLIVSGDSPVIAQDSIDMTKTADTESVSASSTANIAALPSN